jgi:hypothetical protein
VTVADEGAEQELMEDGTMPARDDDGIESLEPGVELARSLDLAQREDMLKEAHSFTASRCAGCRSVARWSIVPYLPRRRNIIRPLAPRDYRNALIRIVIPLSLAIPLVA